ncbi:MAG: hypothetical protein GTN60_05930 [Pseudomonas stutzeri]|nr:hypothetical protein [Stutzerimonas stutzeri]NIP00205.1 hypothetical protein [Stutzerimonas stutzeri]NIQ22802.1 hypothetical protein [Stutzerimonas stutzeri]NIT43689.1 hypothetical protein [Stutzerimonas stutzeri]
MIYMIFAAMLWLPALVSFYFSRSIQWLFFSFALCLYVLLISFSYKSGSDWANYLSDYEAGCVNPNFDIGFRVLCGGFSSVGLSFWIFVAFVKSVFIFSLGFFLWRVGVAPLAVLTLYVLMSVVFLDNLLRQQLAAAFFFIAMSQIDRGLTRPFLWVSAGALFHISVLACAPILLMHRSDRLKSFLLILAVIGFFSQGFGFFSFSNVLPSLLSGFTDSPFIARLLFYLEFERYPVTVGHFFRFLLLVLSSVAYYRAACKGQDGCDGWLRLSYSAVLLMFFYEMFFYDFGVFWMRVKEFFIVFLVVFWVLWIAQNHRSVWVPFFCVFTGYAVYVFWGVFSLPVFDGLYFEYSNFLLHYASPDYLFDAARDEAVFDYWEKWRRGQVR